MKAYELLNAPDVWCQGSLSETAQGDQVLPLDARAVKWCAFGAIQKVYSVDQWEDVMDSVLRILSVSETRIGRMTSFDKACCLMEWNDDLGSSFGDIREVLKRADV